ncbi:MAG: hypothetical protein NC489_36160 [Ruminococcus flavefaciens]|nr:hypothetical protein [Ruminococcus flavefaciens]
MGTFGCYTGNMHISKNKRKEFTRNVLKLLNYGGMMQFEKVNLYGKELILLKPLELDQEKKVSFHFNYFEDDVWESAGYDAEDTDFYSGKIGWKEFNDVVTAVHVLYELYDDEPGMAEINGELVEGSAYIGWINHILGTKFSMKKRFHLWDYFEKHCFDRLESGYNDPDDGYDLRDIIPRSLYWAMGGTEFADICYIRRGTGNLRKEEITPDSYPEAVYQCKIALEQYLKNSHDEEAEQIEKIWRLIKAKKTERKTEKNDEIYEVAECSLKLPAHVLVYLACEIKKLDFWENWRNLYKEAYHDEKMRQYASKKLLTKRKAAIKCPMEEFTTVEFLCDNGVFTFHDTPEELKGKPDYYLSDDDRVFWWDGSEEVILSEKMEQWLAKLAQRHEQIMEEVELEDWKQETFLKKFISVLADADTFYKRLFCFQSMFYEFLQNGTDRRYIAATILLEQMAEEHKEEGRIIERVKSWDITSKNVTHNAGRIAMKRYLGVMANQALRKKYFGF